MLKCTVDKNRNYMYMYMYIHVLMRDENEGRKKASEVKQTTRQSNTEHPQQSLFLRKVICHMYKYMYMYITRLANQQSQLYVHTPSLALFQSPFTFVLSGCTCICMYLLTRPLQSQDIHVHVLQYGQSTWLCVHAYMNI